MQMQCLKMLIKGGPKNMREFSQAAQGILMGLPGSSVCGALPEMA